MGRVKRFCTKSSPLVPWSSLAGVEGKGSTLLASHGPSARCLRINLVTPSFAIWARPPATVKVELPSLVARDLSSERYPFSCVSSHMARRRHNYGLSFPVSFATFRGGRHTEKLGLNSLLVNFGQWVQRRRQIDVDDFECCMCECSWSFPYLCSWLWQMFLCEMLGAYAHAERAAGKILPYVLSTKSPPCSLCCASMPAPAVRSCPHSRGIPRFCLC